MSEVVTIHAAKLDQCLQEVHGLLPLAHCLEYCWHIDDGDRPLRCRSTPGLFSVPAKPLTPGTELITGLALFILGYLITMLGTIATFIRLLYQLSFEATQEAITKGKPAATSSIAMPMAEIKLTPTAMPSAAQPAPQQLEAPRQPMSPVSPPPQQKYCAFCGRPIAVSSKFCPFCQRAQP